MLTAAGEPKPGKGCAAHHIVMKDDGKFPASKNARKILEECGIDPLGHAFSLPAICRKPDHSQAKKTLGLVSTDFTAIIKTWFPDGPKT
ncbi:hypothetical protein AB4090_05335 [Acidithiobacillus sp. IBUN Pt1247-S3]|uniref:hypothetical protein n=1 Tax=Acidithiobacillus sp. IBUN Pt1247-S3 TaxID=3166642 RepID=UPI0034E39F96